MKSLNLSRWLKKKNANIKGFTVRKARSREKAKILTAQHFAKTSKIKKGQSIQSHKGLFHKIKSMSHRSSQSNYKAYRTLKDMVPQSSQQQ